MSDLESRVLQLEGRLAALEDISTDLVVLLAYGTGKAQLISESLAGIAQKNAPRGEADDARAAALTALIARFRERVPAPIEAAAYKRGV